MFLANMDIIYLFACFAIYLDFSIQKPNINTNWLSKFTIVDRVLSRLLIILDFAKRVIANPMAQVSVIICILLLLGVVKDIGIILNIRYFLVVLFMFILYCRLFENVNWKLF